MTDIKQTQDQPHRQVDADLANPLMKGCDNCKRYSNHSQRYFRFGLRSVHGTVWIFHHPMTARNAAVRLAQEEAVNAILSNYSKQPVRVPNFSRLTTDEHGFSRRVFEFVLHHMHNTGEIKWNGNGCNASTIEYKRKINTGKVIELPPGTMLVSLGKGRNKVKMKINNMQKKQLDKRIAAYWEFIKKFDIQHNVDDETYSVVAEYAMLITKNKKFSPPPDNTQILPVAVYNNRAASIGGRFYRAFWIGEAKTLRRLITIDGELTEDVDGDAMHVQLLYKRAGVPLPDGNLYIYEKEDRRRKVAKRLMLYMMNTRKTWEGEAGRMAVIKTYKRQHGKPEIDLMPIVIALEEKHKAIIHLLYRSNWGKLQYTEAGIMLEIMEQGMIDNVPILPVHDGCLCKRSDRDKVLGYFKQLEIQASIDLSHRNKVDVAKMRKIIAGIEGENLL